MHTESISHLKKNLSQNSVPDHLVRLNYFGHAYLGMGDLDALEKIILESASHFAGSHVYFRAACLYSLAQQEKKALQWLKKAISAGFCDPIRLQEEPDLENIRPSAGFKTLMTRYFHAE